LVKIFQTKKEGKIKESNCQGGGSHFGSNMFKVILILCGFILLAWIQVPKMIKNKWWRDLALYGIIFILALYYSLTYTMRWPFIDPIKAVTVLMNGIYRTLGYDVVE